MTSHMRAWAWLWAACAGVGIVLFGWPLLFAFRFPMFRITHFPNKRMS